MGLLRTIALAVLGFSGFVFVALFGRLPVFRKTPVASLYRTVWIYIPNGIRRVDSFLLGGLLLSCWNRLGRYLMRENHPIVLIFFLTIMTGGEILFLPAIWPKISTVHHLLVPGVAVAPYAFLYASVVTKSFITDENHAREMERYPYDGIIFHRGLQCHTCHFLKPARSKHCSLCKTCVSRHDHHCIWLVNCVGQNNYRYFLSFLLSMSVMLVYASYLGYMILCQIRDRLILPTSNLLIVKQDWTTFFDIWCVVMAVDVRIAVVFIMAIMTTPLATAFLVYHVYLIWAGTTTNESGKWAELKDDIADGVVFQSTKHDIYGETTPAAGTPSSWPGHSEQVLILTGGQSPTEDLVLLSTSSGAVQKSKSGGSVDRRWTRVRSMRDVDNIYDIGFWGNLRDALNLPVPRRRTGNPVR